MVNINEAYKKGTQYTHVKVDELTRLKNIEGQYIDLMRSKRTETKPSRERITSDVIKSCAAMAFVFIVGYWLISIITN